MAVNSLGGEVVGPLGLIGNTPVPVIETRTEEQLFQDVTTPTGLKPIQPGVATPEPADPWAGFQDAGFEAFQDAPDQFADFQTADDLDLKSVDELDKARDTFNPAEYLAASPDVAKDPAKLSKLLEVGRRRYDEGLTAKGVAEAALKNTPGLVADIAGGIKRLGERTIDVAVMPTATIILGSLTGDLFNKQRREALFDETKKIIKKGVSEVGAGSEAATIGLVDLTRTGLEKLPKSQVAFPGRFTPPTGAPLPEKKPLTDQQVLERLSDDSAFRQSADAAMRGEGEAAKVAGLDKETLAKQGIEIDEKAIGQLSLVDPITMIAAGGAFKLVGVGGKVLATARTLEGAKAVTDGLTKVASVSRTSKIVGGTIEKVGKVAADARKLQGRGFTAAAIMSGGLDVGLGARLGTAAIDTFILPTVKKVGKTVEQAGKIVAGKPILDVGRAAAESSAGAQRLADIVSGGVKAVEAAGAGAKVVGQGAATGIVAGSPFAIAADSDEQAGALLGVGAALGAGGAAGAKAFRVVRDSTSRRYFGENRPVLPDVPSPGYGRLPELDALNETQMKKLSAQDASEVNNFREILRPQGGEFYNVDQPTFRQKIAEEYKTRTGKELTSDQLDRYQKNYAFFDETVGDKKIVYLNGDTTGLTHDAGHIFDALLSQETISKLDAAIEEAFPKEKIDAFRKLYSDRLGEEISPERAKSEFRAEQFAALFNSVPVTELNAPKGLLNKFIDVIAEGADALGIDLSAGATTPNLGAPVSVGIRKLFQNAAGEVTRRNVEAKPEGVAPAAAAPTPTPVPAPAPASRNIRVTPEQVAAFKQSATPEVRAAAAARAKETGVDYARAEAKKLPEGSARIIEQISDSIESGAPVVQIEHLGITSKSTPDAPAGRAARGVEQAAGYEALEAAQLDVRQNAPPEIVAQHSKNFVPVRWDAQGGSPTLIAMSLDKVISNILKLAADPKAKDLIPYAVENGKLTPDGWREVVADAQAYSENQSNGRKGDGGRLEVPEAGLSIPAENPAYTPQTLTPERANFQNLVQGLAPPQTSRARKGVMPGNIKGQLLAEANIRPTEIPANIPVKQAGKQAFVDFPPRVVKEVNPLRNEMVRRGVRVQDLLEVTERIRAKDMVSATLRPEINYKAPVTDVIRGGFLPSGEYWMDSEGKMISAPKGHDKAAKEILGATFGGSDVYSEMFKRGYTRIISSKEGLYVDSDKPRLSDLSSAQRAGIEDAVLSGGPDKPIELTFNGKRIGGGGPAFLPAPTEFRSKSLQGRTVAEFSEYVFKASPEEWKAATDNMVGGQTGGSWNLGLGLKDRGDLGVLKSYQDKLSDATKAAMKANDFDGAYSLVSRGQFFREALEAAQGTGSAGAAFKRGQMGTSGVKPPFPIEAAATTESTSAGGAGTTTESSKTP